MKTSATVDLSARSASVKGRVKRGGSLPLLAAPRCILALAVILLAVPYLCISASSSTSLRPASGKLAPGRPAGALPPGRALPSGPVTGPAPMFQSNESIATFAPGCTTPKSSFNLGDSVCAVETGAPSFFVPLRFFLWVAPDNTVFQFGPAITSSPENNTITIPATGQFAQVGTWSVKSVDNFGNGYAIARFVVSNPASAAVDLSVFELIPAPVTPGASVNYLVNVSNNGPDDAQSVSLNVTVPTNSTFVSETQNGGPAFACTNGTGSTTCMIGTLPAFASALFTFTYTIGGGLADGTLI